MQLLNRNAARTDTCVKRVMNCQVRGADAELRMYLSEGYGKAASPHHSPCECHALPSEYPRHPPRYKPAKLETANPKAAT